MSVAALRFLWYYPAIISFLGLGLGIWGALLIAFPRGLLIERESHLQMLLGLLFGNTRSVHFKESDSVFTPADEIKGWRCIAWSFLLQAVALVISFFRFQMQ